MTEFEEKQLELLKSIDTKTESIHENTRKIYNNVKFFFWVFIVSIVLSIMTLYSL